MDRGGGRERGGGGGEGERLAENGGRDSHFNLFIYSKSKYILQTIMIIGKFDLKRNNRNIKVAKNCPTLVTVLKEFRVHSLEMG